MRRKSRSCLSSSQCSTAEEAAASAEGASEDAGEAWVSGDGVDEGVEVGEGVEVVREARDEHDVLRLATEGEEEGGVGVAHSEVDFGGGEEEGGERLREGGRIVLFHAAVCTEGELRCWLRL